MDYSGLIKDYLDDANRHLNDYDAALLSLERGGFNTEIISNTLGSLHTLKGNSGMMGFDGLKQYIHAIEELLKKTLEDPGYLEKVFDALLDSANVIRNTLQGVEKDPGASPALLEETALLKNASNGSPRKQQVQTVDLSAYLGAKTDTIKVDFQRLDDLLNLVGELVISKTRLNQVETRLKAAAAEKNIVKDMGDGLDNMGKIISGLQEGIMRARMLPVSHVFNKFPRMVRDLSKSQNKEVELRFHGEDTELDKKVIDQLEEPLLHIIRNALDHGIEEPGQRRTRGKTSYGTITLSAVQESNYVIIAVQDDGQGIDFECVRSSAVRKGLLKPDEAVDRDLVYSCIFAPGFSTKETATDLSGRGVGLDVVSRTITKLNGHVSVNSTEGKGTTFTIKLPLSVAIIRALMAESGGEIYAVPMSAVDESVKVKEEEIHVINNREVIRLREKIVPVFRLDEFFSLPRKKKRKHHLIILGRGDKRIALAVEKIRGHQDIVIKPIDDTIGKSHGIAGASILGDGRVVLIIDVMAFWNARKQGYSENMSDRSIYQEVA